ncbi:GNAT family N-acetyltransferase [Nocardioides pantholopis]|uniref:GNAT family N-acetyltransferase n=1 Tax=Nocardioides pantholopis TaxID=2483798 RepID=UPI000F07CE3E|nr:GNAT family N-acetyltransferase [Nocardioides pantholopis]
MTQAPLLADYDSQLRTDAEMAGATALTRLGPLHLGTFDGARGHVSYRDLDGADAEQVRAWVGETLAHYRRHGVVRDLEWKTRGHDHAPGLHEALVTHGFEPGEPESVMVGETRRLAVDAEPPAGVALRRVSDEADVRAMCAMQDEVFGPEVSGDTVEGLLRRLREADTTELWVAEAAGAVVAAGRLEVVEHSAFAGLWGGATLPGWRGRGIYRALTAVRSRSALARGRTLLHSDCTEDSRPILERSGMVRVSTTTPYRIRL